MTRRPMWELSGGGTDGPHPDTPDPSCDYRREADPPDTDRFDPEDDADLGPHPKGLGRRLGKGHWG